MIVSEITRAPLLFFGLLTAAILLGVLAAIAPVAAMGLMGVMSVLLLVLVIDARPYWVVLFLTAFMPFENLILKFLPFPDQIYLASQFFSEFLIYLAFAVLVLRKMVKGASFRRTPIDVLLLTFIGIAILSIVINQSPVLGSLMNLRSLLRYVILFYLVVNLDFTPKQVDRLLRIILFIGLVQLFIAALQLISNGALHEFLMPKQVDAGVFGKTREFVLVRRGRELGGVFGTLGDTLYFGLFILTVAAVYLGRLKRLGVWNMLFLALILTAIMFSYVRAAVFGMALMLLIFYRIRYGLRKTFMLSSFIFLVALVMLVLFAGLSKKAEFINPVKEKQGIVKNVTGIFSQAYVENARKQRLGALIGITPTVLANSPFLGYGPDEEQTIERLYTSHPSFLLQTLTKKGFEDVYWVALLAYYGLAGVGILIFFFYRLFVSAWKIYRTATHNITRKMACTAICIIGVTPFLLFFNQILEFRSYGFYFWLFPALMYGLYARERDLIVRSERRQ